MKTLCLFKWMPVVAFTGLLFCDSVPAQTLGPGSALKFVGTNSGESYVTMGNESAFNFSGAFTIEAWFKVSSLDETFSAIITKGDSAWRIQRYNATGQISFGTTGLNNIDLPTTNNVNDGQWHHVAAVWDGAGNKLIYLDGVLNNSTNGLTGPVSSDAYSVLLGENQQSTGRVWDGNIDEVRIWNTARSASQIQTNMHRSLTGSESGLVAYYRLDDGSGTSVSNAVPGGSAENGTFTGTVAWVASQAPVGAPLVTTVEETNIGNYYPTLMGTVDPSYQSATASFRYGTTISYGSNTPSAPVHGGVLFTNNETQLVNVPNSAVPTGTSPYTIEAWIYPYTMGDEGIVGWGNFGNNDQVNALRLDANGPRNDWWGDDLSLSGANSTNLTGAWHHVAAVSDGTHRTLYLDGVALTNDTAAGTHTVQAENLEIGVSGVPNPGQGQWFNGIIDEVRIWNTNLSQATLTNWMFQGITSSHPDYANLQAYWSLNEGSGSNAVDLTGRGNNGTLASYWDGIPPVWTTGQTLTNEVIGFPLTNLARGNSYHFALTATNAGGLTIGSDIAFVVPSSPQISGGAATLIASNNASLIATVNAGELNTTVYFEYGPSTNYASFTATNLLAANSTASGITNALTGLAFDSVYHFQIVASNSLGVTSSGDLQFLTGSAAPTLTGSTVSGVLPGGGTLSETISPNGQLTGEVIEYGLTPSYGTTSAVVQLDGALWFNGSNDYVNVNNEGAFNFSGPFTVEAWIKVDAFTNSWQAIVTKGDSSWRLQRNYNSSSLDFGTTFFGNGDDLLGVTSVNDGQWHHVAGVFDGNNKYLYVDGQLDATDNNTTEVDNDSYPVYIGENAEQTGRVWDGSIAEVRLWNTNLSQSTIQAWMNRGLTAAHPDSTWLAGYWKLNELIGTDTPDSSGFGNDGTLVNGPLLTNGPPITNDFATVSVPLTGLLPDTTYYYQVVATNSSGQAAAAQQMFTTSPGVLPVVTTLPASGLNQQGATLNGTVQTYGLQSSVSFQYGLTTNYGSITPPASMATTNAVAFSQNVTGLAPGTTFHYRAFATNIVGATNGLDQVFSTLAFPGDVTVLDDFDYYLAAAADVNNDGQMDIVAAGGFEESYSLIVVALNEGNGNFYENQAIEVPGGVNYIIPADFNNDGYVDFVSVGETNVPDTENYYPWVQVWTNSGNGTFGAFGPVIPGLLDGSVAVGDFNNDGLPDILLTGVNSNNQPLTQIWLNQGNGSFVNMNANLPGMVSGSVAVSDFDRDGYLDVLLSGDDVNGNAVSQIWRNLGNGTFSNFNAGLPGLANSAVAVGDFDNDGYPDVVLSGLDTNDVLQTEVWRNQGNGTFSNLNVGLPGAQYGSIVVCDFDSDGYPDILLTGQDYYGDPLVDMWRNQGNGTFASIATQLAPTPSAAAIGDFNNDGRPDIVIANEYGNDFDIAIATNGFLGTNTPPTAPGGLAAAITNTQVVLSWNAASDTHTPTAGLGYNVRLATVPGGVNVASPLANLGTGYRRYLNPGNASEDLEFTLPNLPIGTYYWSVQALNAGLVGSPFATEGTFTLNVTPATGSGSQVSFTSAGLNGSVNPDGTNTAAWFQWGTTTNYGSQTATQTLGNGTDPASLTQVLPQLQPGTTYYFQLVISNGVGLAYGAGQSFTTPVNTPPTVSAFTNVATALNATTPAIPFTIGDAQIPAGNLVVTAITGNSTLVPPANLILGGSGANRTLTIVPAANQRGQASISVSVSDGLAVTTANFIVSVGLIPGDLNGDGIVEQSEFNAVLGAYLGSNPLVIQNLTALTNNMFEFSLTNLASLSFTVLGTTNVGLPYGQWSVVGPAALQFQFTDPSITNQLPHFYLLQYP